MAAIPNHPPEIARLLELSEASRASLGGQVAALRQRLDGPAKVVHSLRAHPLRWVGGAVATGLATALVFRRRPNPARKPKGATGLLLSLALAAAKPVLKTWLTKQFKDLLATQLNRLASPRPHPASVPADPGPSIRY